MTRHTYNEVDLAFVVLGSAVIALTASLSRWRKLGAVGIRNPGRSQRAHNISADSLIRLDMDTIRLPQDTPRRLDLSALGPRNDTGRVR